ncbi:helix-turn-helix domain-containing protein [Desulfosporosinus nitroreducens]|uniref:Helix-turn-helix domain-containing protein n=1 Tax=Desulfosporosinus nitroreducens TaxID=2018668 RepID=A0ABT8QL84_9FIRM|nr:helix-turn-helix transcriptional regulator [Desulfosporosinus nitroreducens]MDO0822087.1 helix-turn-helix domain-containing protein [Desulfosporosinus nitroreducens]
MLLTNETLGKRIAHYRKERNLTQVNLATSIGIRPGHYSDIETGRKVPRIHTLARLAATFRVSIDELVGKC